MAFSVTHLVCLCFLRTVVANGLNFRKPRDYDNIACPVTTKWGLGATPSAIHCADLCGQQAGCFSFFYNVKDGSCVGVGDLRVPDHKTCGESTGNSFYTMEVYGAPCATYDCNPIEHNLQCSEGRCKCTDFYNLIPSKRVCAANCDGYGYGDTFELYSDLYMMGQDYKDEVAVAYEACQQYCLDEPPCKSFDYVTGTGLPCRISRATLRNSPEREVVHGGAVYSQRNCQ